MVRRVTRRRERVPAEDVAVGDAHVLLRHRRELAPERVEHLAVEPARRALEPRRVDRCGARPRSPRPSARGGGGRASRRRRRGRGGCARAAGGGRRSARARAPRARLRARRASTSARSRTAPARRRVDDVDADRLRRAAEVQVDDPQRSHNPIFAVVDLPLARLMRLLLVAASARPGARPRRARRAAGHRRRRSRRCRLIHYRAHDGVLRPAWLLLPAGYHGQRDPARHLAARRGVDAPTNALPLGRPAGRGRLRGDQPGRRGAAAALVLVGRAGPDRRPRAHAGDRAGTA